MKSNIQFYGEWVEYHDDNEKQEAMTYLALWKKFTIRKLGSEFVIVDEQYKERNLDHLVSDCLQIPKNTIGIKVAVRKKDTDETNDLSPR